MVSKLRIHFWDIPGYININFETKKMILEKILQKYSISAFAKKLNISNVGVSYFLKNKNSFMKIKNLLNLIKCLKISKIDIEKNIIAYRDTSSKDPFFLNFPYYLSPLHMRVVGVLVGDGNVHKTNHMMRWIQKDPVPLKNLMKIILGDDVVFNIHDTQIVIPAFFGKILCHSLSLNLSFLASEKLIEKSLNLDKDYSLVLLIAIIEDEGNIDAKNCGGINIRMASKEIIYAIEKLCDYLGYKTSQIIFYKNNGTFSTNNKKLMYKIQILSDGIKKLGYDLIKLKKKYGKEIGLWKKEDQFFRRWETCINKKAEKNREGRNIHNKINSLFVEHKTLSPLQVSRILLVSYDRIYDLMKNMRKRGEIKRVNRGTYTKLWI